MRNPARIILGIIVFLVLLSVPIWVTQAAGNANEVPDLVYPDADTIAEISGSADFGCLQDAEYMRVNHMDLVKKYRTWAMRSDADDDPGDATWINANGEEVPFSLNGTCLGCHTDRSVFCDECHNYTDTEPTCWACHDKSWEGS